jgi:dipeptidyl aminopeptidase/acylaminoacyl peptidase
MNHGRHSVGVIMERTPFELDDAPYGPLRGDVYLPPDARGTPVVVACHGFKGFKDWGFWPETARSFCEAGIGFVAFNFSGSGIGEDPEAFTELDRFEANTIGRELEDLGRVLDAVTRRSIPVGGVDVRRLGLLGHSRGGGVALIRTSRDPRIRATATWAAVASFLRVDEEERKRWRERGFAEVLNQRTGQVFRMGATYLDDLETHAEAYDPLLAVERLKVPLLLVHGTQDDAVPVDDARRLARHAAPGTASLALIQGAGHTFGAAHPFTGVGGQLSQVLSRSTGFFLQALSA